MAARVGVLEGMSSHERFSRVVCLQQCTEYLSVCRDLFVCLFEIEDVKKSDLCVYKKGSIDFYSILNHLAPCGLAVHAASKSLLHGN